MEEAEEVTALSNKSAINCNNSSVDGAAEASLLWCKWLFR